jgi:hypothetical protein
LRQVDVAQGLGRYQSYVSHVGSGQKVINAVSLVMLRATALFRLGKAGRW